MVDLSDRPLVETEWLAKHLDDPDLRIVNARWRGMGAATSFTRTGIFPVPAICTASTILIRPIATSTQRPMNYEPGLKRPGCIPSNG